MASSRLARRRRSARTTGLVVLAVFLLMVYLALNASHGVPGASRTKVQASFADVGGLLVGDDVRIASVRIGSVTDIKLVDGKALVTLAIDGSRAFYRDAAAEIAQRSALGQDYVDLDPGTTTAGALPTGTVIGTTPRQNAQDLSRVLSVLDAPTRKSLQTLVQNTGGGADGHAGDLHDALSALPTEVPDLKRVAAALSADGGADTTHLIAALHGFAQNFTDQQQTVAALTDQLATTLDAIDTDRGAALAKTLDVAPGALTALRGSLTSLESPLADTDAAVTQLRPGALALSTATPDLRGLLREAVQPLDEVPSVARQATGPLGDLTAALHDARPLAPDLSRLLGSTAGLLTRFAPYSPDMSLWFTYATQTLSQGDANGHWLRLYVTAKLESVDGYLNVSDPVHARDAYPRPGTATTEKTGN